MDPLTQLPLECLQRILQHIQRERNKTSLDTLFSLLRVSRYIATVTIPIIYEDPFNGHGNNTPIVSSLLAQTLLSSPTYCATIHPETCNNPLSNGAVHPFLAMRLRQFLRFSPLPTASASTQFDYLSHVRHISPVRYDGRRVYHFWSDSKSLSTEETAYIEEHQDEVELQCQLDGVTVAPNLFDICLHKWLLYHLHGVSLLRETIWALAVPILDQLESLTIPLSDIRRYRAVVERLGRLERICILQDEIYQSGDTIDEGSRSRRDESMQAMVMFVKAHAQCHPGRLKDVHCETNTWPFSYLYFPDEIRLQVYRALPPPTKRKTIDMYNYLPVLAHPQTVDLGHVEQVYQARNGFPWLEKAVREEPRFLQRCRRLKSIHMNSLGRGSFDWAVSERRSVDDNGFVTIEDTDNSVTNFNHNDYNLNNEHRSAGLPSRESSFRSQQQQHRGRLVPLESMLLYKTTYDCEINDIAFAFSRTLKSLAVGNAPHGTRRPPVMGSISTPEESIFPTCHIGRGWVDMRLKTLRVDSNGAQLMLDPFLFTQCPDLIEVGLSDGTRKYQCQEIPLSIPAQLSSLERLNLQGLPALSFHPATFETTTKLKRLLLSVKAGSQTSFYIPPVEELTAFYDGSSEVGSLWTWDWHLPQLTELHLTGEFAYRFQFRMLRGCPALRELGLNMRNAPYTGKHTRILTIRDFSAEDNTTVTSTNTTSINADLQNQTPAHIVLQSLKQLLLAGTWIVDDSIIPLLLHEMCPTIRKIALQDCIGFSSTSIANTLRTSSNPFLELSLSSPPPSAEEQVQLGMYSFKDWVMDRKEARDCNIRFQSEQFFLLRDPEVFSGGRHATQHQG
ncbi:hypothetical protein K457DRAFT_16208 [Linnemannia elongata AG-77]|uniref:Uncharacterized protein n=1 Tax=Linnemannia elongata AG-77 TaxID=1314771 RepID=A0A197K7G6_9FUNG|nr:hypothetical protein K457DRAFT_16208 [Linnemannia elongata AG-77]